MDLLGFRIDTIPMVDGLAWEEYGVVAFNDGPGACGTFGTILEEELFCAVASCVPGPTAENPLEGLGRGEITATLLDTAPGLPDRAALYMTRAGGDPDQFGIVTVSGFGVDFCCSTAVAASGVADSSPAEYAVPTGPHRSG